MALSGELKQATAATVKVGPFVDDTDGASAETSLTLTKADVRLSKNGGNFAAASADQGTSDAGAAHDEIGYYDISLNATDTNTVGILTIAIHESGALPVRQDYMILPASQMREVIRRSTAQAGDDTEITLDASASATDGAYNGMIVFTVSGTGLGQFRVVTGYVGSTKVATIEPAWITNPSSDTVFEIIGTPPGAGVEDAVTSALATADVATGTDVSDVETSIPTAVWAENAGEPAGVPEFSDAYGDILGYLLARLRNKSTFNKSTGAWALRNDADDADLATRTDSNDGTTYVKGEES